MSVQRIQPVHRNRIDWCCAQQNVSVDDLAKKLSVKPERLDAEALRKSGLTYGQLKNVAAYFNRGILFFLEDEPINETEFHTPQFRTLSRQEPSLSPKMKAIIERTEQQRDLLLALQEDLDAEQTPVRIPRVNTDRIPEAARKTREWLGLSDQGSFADYRIAVENKGILVFRSNGYAGKWQVPQDSSIAGFSIFHELCHVIFVRKLEPEPRQTFTLMHELGHLLLHKASFIDPGENFYATQGRERDANMFAGHVLVPESYLEELDQSPRPTAISELYAWLKGFRKKWGVSGEVILRRMLDTQRATEREYNAYRRHVSQLPASTLSSGGNRYRHREPKHVFGTRYVRTVFDALRSNHISLSKASSCLDSLKIKDLQQLESHVADL